MTGPAASENKENQENENYDSENSPISEPRSSFRIASQVVAREKATIARREVRQPRAPKSDDVPIKLETPPKRIGI